MNKCLKVEMFDIKSLATQYSFYLIIADGYIYGSLNSSELSTPNSTWNRMFHQTRSFTDQFPVVIDTGGLLIHLPSEISDAYAAQFRPAAEYNVLTGEYWAPCTAEIPKFGVVIAGKKIFLHKDDLLRQEFKLDWNGDGVMHCRLGVADGRSGPYILGDVFLNSVVAVFDIGASEMRFAQRTEL
jgi:hypothetical protein